MGIQTMKLRFFRAVWCLVPWFIVSGLALFVVQTAGRINTEKNRLELEKRNSVKAEIPPVNVITLLVQPHPLADSITLPAEIQAEQELWVKAEVSGRVVETHAREGMKIQRGRVLMSLDDRDYRNRLARIQANYSLARTEYERNLALAKTNATAQASLDSIEARLKELEAQKSDATLALDRTRIKAPISCVLNELKAKKGDFLSVGDPVAQALNIDPVKVTVGVPESDVASVFDISEAEVIIPALENLLVTGNKIFLSRKPRTLARLYDLELEVSNPEGRILPGMFARVKLVKKTFDRAVTVPLYAVLSRGGERYVFVETGGKADKRPVSTGLIKGWKIHVTDGLDPGDRLVVAGHRAIEHGRSLNVVEHITDPEGLSAQ
jgi:membrane fusion protein, multidrug efflux system